MTARTRTRDNNYFYICKDFINYFFYLFYIKICNLYNFLYLC